MQPFSDACERNKEPILAVLRQAFAGCTRVLEVGSGTGQHAVHFCAHLPHVLWHPTEREAGLPDLAARILAEGSPNIQTPAILDVAQAIWPVSSVDAVFTANTLHIMSWSEVLALFNGIGNILAPDGVLCIYGPFRYAGSFTSNSNRDFDGFLRRRDPASGLRELTDVTELAARYGITLEADHDLPAFNRLLVFRRGHLE